jgi:hypothetical protein
MENPMRITLSLALAVAFAFSGACLAHEAPVAAATATPLAAPALSTLFQNVRIYDGKSDALSAPANVLVKGNRIERIASTAIAAEATDTLMRGFTTVRDLGGPAFGLKRAIDEGIVAGPRIYPSGAMITVTSGHGDFRQPFEVPRVVVDGDRVRISGFRNFDFRSRDDFTARYEEREVSLSHLTGVDFFISFWMEGPVGHTFVSFIFDNALPVSISIETRPEKGEGFDPLASMFKQFEQIYVIGDEHDLVGLRTSHRDKEVFLYHVQASPEAARRLFLVYLERIHELADQPEWYHLLSNNYTINIVRHMNLAGPAA